MVASALDDLSRERGTATQGTGPAWLDEGYYSIPEAARRLLIGHERLRTWCRSELIRSHKGASRQYIVCAADIDTIRDHIEAVKSTLNIDVVRRLREAGKIGQSKETTKPFPVGTLPLDMAMGLIQESMREALADYGMLRGASEIIVSSATREIERLYEIHLTSPGGE